MFKDIPQALFDSHLSKICQVGSIFLSVSSIKSENGCKSQSTWIVDCCDFLRWNFDLKSYLLNLLGAFSMKMTEKNTLDDFIFC